MESLIKYDYHLHTINSPDGIATMEEQIQEAINKRFEQICFTEHMDFNEFTRAVEPDFLDMNKYQKEFEILKEKYLGKINLRFGIELGLQPHTRKAVYEFVNKYNFDFVIGSLHDPEGYNIYIDNGFFAGRTQKEAYTKYLSEMLGIVENYNDEFDVLGHIDYIIRYGNFEKKKMEYEEYSEWIDKILRLVIEKGKGIEINTSRYQIWI